MTTAHPRGRALGRGLHTLISPGPEPATDEPTMDLTTGAAPGVEEHADAAAEAACRLADSAHATGWSATAVEDAVDAIDYLVEALSTLDPRAARILADVPTTTAALLKHLEHTQREEPPAPPPSGSGRRARRRLGPGWQGTQV
ncbi:hypothetical protein ABZ502_29905 [Streptomyces abikoensis]|uniref:hypothetical protein n=1 Tax=Streptomyces abikoensis TaxID=97398 RepID=UPI0033C64C17